MVADSNVISPSYARRFLCSLAAEFGWQLGIVPELESEFPGVLARELVRREQQRRKHNNQTLPKGAQRECKEIAARWLQSAISYEDSAFIRCCDEETQIDDAAELIINSDLADAFVDDILRSRLADESIVSQSLVAGADFIVTINMKSINHKAVNEYARRHGINHDVILHPNVAIQHLIDPSLAENRRRVALAALAVSISDKKRESQAEIDSVFHFLRFASTPLGHPSLLAGQAINDAICQQEIASMLDEAREKAKRGPWRAIRSLENAMRNAVRSIGR